MDALLLFLATGAAAGLLAGLFGVGGGLIMVPALALLLPGLGVQPEVTMQVAIGTSLAVISATSVSSMLAHHRRDGILWPVFRRLAPGLAAGAAAGAFAAHELTGLILQRIVGIGALLVAVQMFLDLKPKTEHGLPGATGLFSAGAAMGLLSALIGIGGGSLTVPYLSGCGVHIRQAVGTAAACGVPIAWAGAAGFMLAGLGVAGRPEWSLGYVSLPGFAGLAVASVLTAPLGARLAHRLPPKTLRRAFAALLLAIGLGLILKSSSLGAFFEFGADRFHPLAVDAEVGVPEPRGGAHVQQLLLRHELKFDVVHITHQPRAELGVEVSVVPLDDPAARHGLHDCDQALHCRLRVLLELQRRDVMQAIGRIGLAANVVGLVDAGRELAVLDTQVAGPLAAELEHALSPPVMGPPS